MKRNQCTPAQGSHVSSQQQAQHQAHSRLANKPLRSSSASKATSTLADPKTSTKQQDTEPTAFDWRNQWYPVHFVRDLPEGQPQRVYIFDEPVVLLKRPGNQGVVALRDRCPHRAAALSEGRMTPDGQLQCAYHGWSFDGESGICTNIPQVTFVCCLSKVSAGSAMFVQKSFCHRAYLCFVLVRFCHPCNLSRDTER